MNNSDKEYWFFRLVRTFFTDDEMRYMKKLPDGYKYIVIYLELCCLSVRGKGYVKIPRSSPLASFASDLALDLEEREGDVIKTLSILTELNLIEILENSIENIAELRIPQVINNTGRSSKYADYMRSYREEQITGVKQALPEGSTRRCGKYRNVYLSLDEAHDISSDTKRREMVIDLFSDMKKRNVHDAGKTDYENCIEIAERLR